MINSTFGGFMVARLGLSASQKGLYITGQNLTNSGTDGYTRQRLDQVSLNINGYGRYASPMSTNIGNGVLVTGTSQLRDPFLDLRFRNEVAHVGEQDVKLSALNDLKNILDEVKNQGDDPIDGGGIFNQLGDVLNKLEQLSNQVGNKEFDNMVKSSCQVLVTLFNSYSDRINEVRENMEYDLQNVDVPRVNEILKSIQELNKTIKSSEMLGDSALELKDQRNMLIDELSSYMKIDVTYDPIQVSDSTYVDELHIAMVGKDGKKYDIIADDQCREFQLSEEDGKLNISLSGLSPLDPDLKTALEYADATLKQMQEVYNNRINTFNNAKTALETAMKDLTALENQNAALNEELYGPDADKDGKPDGGGLLDAYKAANAAYVKGKQDKLPEAELNKLEAALTTARENYNNKLKELDQNKTAINNQKNAQSKAQKDYNNALANLDKADANGTLLGIDGKPITADDVQGLAAKNLDKAKTKYNDALAALQQSDINGQPIDSVNDLFTDGILKGALEMLNYSGDFDNPPNDIRGIGYYQNMLDSLANKFATEMNNANNPDGIVFKDENGNVIRHDLFKSEDGGKITASNINIADGWTNNSYGITASADPNAPVGQSDNISHMITLFGEKLQYKADIDLMGDIQIDTQTLSIGNMKDGDTITIDGKTYTYNSGSTGKVGNTFSDFDSLKLAASKNGVALTGDSKTGVITGATSTNIDLKDTVSFNGKSVGDLSSLDFSKMTYGDTITIDGNTFTYKPDATGADNTFKDLATLQTAASKNNIDITATGNSITGVNKKAGVDLTNDVKIDQAPSIKNMQNGDTITIDGNTFTFGTDFTDMASLQEAAKDKGITIYGNATTGEITSASKVGENIFNGTFEESFTNIGVVLGIDIKSTTEKLTNYSNLASSISEQREAVTGVSLDEEAMNIMKYQQSYNASAKLMTALDEMLTTLINI
ncbi:MAG: hypothetical protein KHZ62_01015 [Clostridiales bacterium]|nr:hypothetical protein [Clostridiales bacterium]